MKLNNVRLLVRDFDNCFKFYSEKVGLKVTWGRLGGEYASFDIGLESNNMGLSIYKSDLMAMTLGNSHLQLPIKCREKIVIVIQVESVNEVYRELTEKGVEFINKPIDIASWGSRVAHFRDPEENIIEIYSELSKDKWSNDLIEESKDNENK